MRNEKREESRKEDLAYAFVLADGLTDLLTDRLTDQLSARPTVIVCLLLCLLTLTKMASSRDEGQGWLTAWQDWTMMHAKQPRVSLSVSRLCRWSPNACAKQSKRQLFFFLFAVDRLPERPSLSLCSSFPPFRDLLSSLSLLFFFFCSPGYCPPKVIVIPPKRPKFPRLGEHRWTDSEQ